MEPPDRATSGKSFFYSRGVSFDADFKHRAKRLFGRARGQLCGLPRHAEGAGPPTCCLQERERSDFTPRRETPTVPGPLFGAGGLWRIWDTCPLTLDDEDDEFDSDTRGNSTRATPS